MKPMSDVEGELSCNLVKESALSHSDLQSPLTKCFETF